MLRIRILVVDDDRSQRQIVGKFLAERGYEVETSEDGEAAIAALRRQPADLAIVDYMMPGMNGVETFRKARQICPAIMGVFVTGHATINTVFPAFEAGIERVLGKPADPNELLAIVERLLGRDVQSRPVSADEPTGSEQLSSEARNLAR